MQKRCTVRPLIAAIGWIAILSGCNVPDRWMLASYDAYPTALDYWREERLLLAGSYEDGIVHALRHDGIPASRPFLVPDAHGPRRALRLRVDNLRDRLWILDTDGAYVYTLHDRRLVAKIPLPHAALSPSHCLPDMALDEKAGSAYVSDPLRPLLHVIEPGREEKSYHVRTIELQSSNERAAEGLSALAALPGETTLIAGSAASGAVWRVDPTMGNVEHIALPRGKTLAGICAMSALTLEATHAHRSLQDYHVFLTTAQRSAVFRLHLTRRFGAVAVKQVAPSMDLADPLGVVVMNGYLVVSGSQLSRHPHFGGQGDPAIPFRLAVMPAEHEPVGPIAGGR
jgi:hypothetical protein